MTSMFPLVYAAWSLGHLSWAGNSPGTKSALGSGTPLWIPIFTPSNPL